MAANIIRAHASLLLVIIQWRVIPLFVGFEAWGAHLGHNFYDCGPLSKDIVIFCFSILNYSLNCLKQKGELLEYWIFCEDFMYEICMVNLLFSFCPFIVPKLIIAVSNTQKSVS